MTNQPQSAHLQRASEASLRAGFSDSGATKTDIQNADVPAVRPLVHVLWISNSDAATPSASAQALWQKISERGHDLIQTSRGDWRQALRPNAQTAAPEVILLDPAAEFESARLLCVAIKAELGANSAVEVPLIVVSSPDDASEATADEMWAWWQGAGCDALVGTEIGPAELQSSLQLWARQARMGREFKTLRDTLLKQVQIDDLTGVLNRRFFFQAAHREVSRSRRYNHHLGCLMVDIDCFKLYNKNFGYACGDFVLRQVAAIIRTWTRDSDIVARFGAKKFVILLPETDVDGAMRLHQKLQDEIEAFAFEWRQMPLPVSISVGEAERHVDSFANASLRSRDGSSPYEADVESEEGTLISVREELADLLEDADAALYVAKKGVRYPRFQSYASCEDEVIGILGSV